MDTRVPLKKTLRVPFLGGVEALIIVFLLLIGTLVLLFGQNPPKRLPLFGLNILLCLAVCALAWLTYRNPTPLATLVRAWYCFPLLVLIYKEMHWVVHTLRKEVYDSYIIQIDRFIFGTDPTVFLYRFAHPLLTELLQTVYVLFYFFPLTIGIALIRKNRYREFFLAVFIILYGFFVSYVGYILVPAIGPRFTLHDFYAIDRELPGLWLTPFFREFVNRGEGITSTLPNAAELVQRDVFPSGHTLITLLTLYLSFRFKSRTRFVLAPLGILLILSTVYLRYHYATDLLASFLLFPFVLWSGTKLYLLWEGRVEHVPERQLP